MDLRTILLENAVKSTIAFRAARTGGGNALITRILHAVAVK